MSFILPVPTVPYGWEELVDTLSMKILGGSVLATSAQAEVSERQTHTHPSSLISHTQVPTVAEALAGRKAWVYHFHQKQTPTKKGPHGSSCPP